MSPSAVNCAPNWDEIRLVVFDVDGTLYDQRGLRLCMLREMLLASIRSRAVDFIRVLRAYRRIREELGESLHEDFERELTSRTAALVGCTEAQVQSMAGEWLERRPLRHLIRYRYPGLPELFRGLRKRGKRIGIFSDYPASAKLEALGLEADDIVCAGDRDVRVLKPHPRGLQVLMSRMAARPAETLLIGDRPERDGLAAQAAGAGSLIRSRKPIEGWQTFDRYDAAVFSAADLLG
ncbi:MAG TPA: HAD family hydrolase [Steroidobacteraceae bacterium]